ncbi:MAG: hypothetical protein Q4C96_10185 [Planctomycetia bacterium]|nr:hypothetical protein [Planctomycetia bacterium]
MKFLSFQITDSGIEKSFSNVSSPRESSWGNLLVFLLISGIVLLIFFPFSKLWNTDNPTEHPLVNAPLSGLEYLAPLLGETSLSESVLNEKTILLIFWGPWDDQSCRFLAELNKTFNEAQKNESFFLLPVAYFVSSPKLNENLLMTEDNTQNTDENTAENEKTMEKAALEFAYRQESPLRTSVEQAFQKYSFFFTNVWWDPLAQMRESQQSIAMHINTENSNKTLSGIALPTIILAKHGIIHAVWSGYHPQYPEEIKTYLMPLLNMTPSKLP